MKIKVFTRFVLALTAMLAAGTAHADNYFYVDDINLRYFGAYNGSNITIPVKASFDNRVTVWDVRFVFPQGLTPVSITKGSDMNFTFTNSRGREVTDQAMFAYNSGCNHFFGVSSFLQDYYYDAESDEYVAGSCMAWEPGQYDEMFLVTVFVDYDYYGDIIQVISDATCTYDNLNGSPNLTRDPSVTGWLMPADVDGDGTVSISDATTLLNFIVFDADDSSVSGGDLNRDGLKDLLDVAELVDYLMFEVPYIGYERYHGYSVAEAVYYDLPISETMFYFDPFSISLADVGHEITIPIKAEFTGYVTSWQLSLDLPGGLTPVSITQGRDMMMTYRDEEGITRSWNARLSHNDEFTNIMGIPIIVDYMAVEGDSYEPYGTARWEAGTYDELFLLTVRVEDFFTGGVMSLAGQGTCGVDMRDGMADYYWISPIETSPDAVPIHGDVNGDGVISVDDVVCLLDYISSESGYSSICDINQDSLLDVVDANKLMDFLIFGNWYEPYLLGESIPFECYIEKEEAVIVPGDMDGDGRITVSDITQLIQLLLNEGNLTNPIADVNNDGVVNVSDITDLINMVLNAVG